MLSFFLDNGKILASAFFSSKKKHESKFITTTYLELKFKTVNVRPSIRCEESILVAYKRKKKNYAQHHFFRASGCSYITYAQLKLIHHVRLKLSNHIDHWKMSHKASFQTRVGSLELTTITIRKQLVRARTNNADGEYHIWLIFPPELPEKVTAL